MRSLSTSETGSPDPSQQEHVRNRDSVLSQGTKSVILASPMPLREDLMDVDRAMCSNARVGGQDTVKSELIASTREKKNKTSKNVAPTLCLTPYKKPSASQTSVPVPTHSRAQDTNLFPLGFLSDKQL